MNNAITGSLISADHISRNKGSSDASNIDLVFATLSMRSLLVFRLEYCYDVNNVKSEATHSKETGYKNGFKPFPLKPRNINRLLTKKSIQFFQLITHYVNNITRIKLCFLWYWKRRLTYLLVNNQITSNINEVKTIEYAKLNKNKIRKNSHRANMKR